MTEDEISKFLMKIIEESNKKICIVNKTSGNNMVFVQDINYFVTLLLNIKHIEN